jgi:hypothetical protein
MAQTGIPNALAEIQERSKDVPWYNPDVGSQLGDSARELLENYSNIPAAEVEDHVYKVVCCLYKVSRELRLRNNRSVMKHGTSSHIHASVDSDFLTCTSRRPSSSAYSLLGFACS